MPFNLLYYKPDLARRKEREPLGKPSPPYPANSLVPPPPICLSTLLPSYVHANIRRDRLVGM